MGLVGLDSRELRAALAEARHLYVSGCAAEIDAAPGLIARHCPPGATVAGIMNPVVNLRSYADGARGQGFRTFFPTPAALLDTARGIADYSPWSYSTMSGWMRAPGRFDTALVMVSPTDADGTCSLGVQADFLPDFWRGVRRLIGFVNPRMPRTEGETRLPADAFCLLVDCEADLLELPHREADETAAAIARHAASLIGDDCTVQFGIGQIPALVAQALSDRKRLRIHSGVIDRSVITLMEAGALAPDRPVVAGVALGSREFYAGLDRDPRYRFMPVSHTHSLVTLASLPRFVSVNSVLQVDLAGQANAETSRCRIVASPGGLPDFVRGAMAAPGGISVLALRARGKGSSRGIVARLGPGQPATLPRVDADVIVTEFGIAHVRNLGMEARAEAIIAIADPEDRASLRQAWQETSRTAVMPKPAEAGRRQG